MCVWAGDTWEVSVPSAQFCYKPKTALKSKSYLKLKQVKKKQVKSILIALYFLVFILSP